MEDAFVVSEASRYDVKGRKYIGTPKKSIVRLLHTRNASFTRRENTDKLGRGFSRTNLYNMRQFYLDHRTFQSVIGELTWTHYCELMGARDHLKRSFCEREAAKSGWNVRGPDR